MSQMEADDVELLLMAAGVGSRMGVTVRKQWLPFCGQPLFLFTLGRLRSAGLKAAVLVVHPEDVDAVARELVAREWSGVRVTAGGSTRQSSVCEGLRLCTRPLVIVHDAARPLTPKADIAAVIAAARACGAATVGHPARDSLKRADRDGRICETVPREGMWQVQTPQAFHRVLLQTAHERALADGYEGTDDAALAERLGAEVHLVHGSAWNVKITDGEDLTWFKVWEEMACALD